MITERQLFLQHVAQTSPLPLLFEVSKGEGMYLYDTAGEKYMDLIAGISVCNLGHCHPTVVKAIQEQAEKYTHVMVYGEFIQSPQVQLATLLAQQLPAQLDSIYFTNSGTEAVEGAMKLAKRYTGRTQIVSFKKAYHGSTQGALSIMGDEYYKNAFRPLLPDILQLDYGDFEQLELITNKTAAVIIEPVQGEAGVIFAGAEYLCAVRKKCTKVGVLMITDEVQTGMGRTGTLYAFEQLGYIPDVLLTAKAFGAGLPLGAFISSRTIMQSLTNNPVLGHITTFGGNAVCCAASLAGLKTLITSGLMQEVKKKEMLFRNLLAHKNLLAVRSYGLLLSLEFENAEICSKVMLNCLKRGAITDWFLHAPHCLRIAPPLIISETEIMQACDIINDSINEAFS